MCQVLLYRIIARVKLEISTHTLTWSVTYIIQILRKKVNNFNSHAHVERDLWTFINWQILYVISTHTLTWSVTSSAVFAKLIPLFQLTRSRGAWRKFFITAWYFLYFNSHAHVERDIFNSRDFSGGKNFNSHAHVERDIMQKWKKTPISNFNSHAHVERDIMIIV